MSSREFRALVSLHSGHINKSPKDHEAWARINSSAPWLDGEITPLELADWIQSGKAWTACHLGGRSHSEDSVLISNLIVLDIDGDLTLETFWAIPAVQRHCLFTATSCSHTGEEHRFRALFACDAHDDIRLHGAIYDLWVERLGLRLKDDCGRKPERLWYGNDKAILQFGGGEPIPWDLIEQARDVLAAAAAARTAAAASSLPGDIALDCRRAVFAFDHLLRVSVDGDFSGGYWKELLLAAAASGDEAVQQGFLQWHNRGHHARTQTQVKRRLQRSRSRMTPGEGVGKILKLTKAQHGEQWWRLLPPELQYGQSAPIPPISLLRSRSASDVAADGTPRAPDTVPPVRELERLAEAAQPLSLMASRGPEATSAPDAPGETLSQNKIIEQLLFQLYTVETERKLITEEGEQQLTAQEARYKADQLESDLQAFPVFRVNPQRIRTRLLEIFCDCNGISQRSDHERRLESIHSQTRQSNEYLFDGLMVRGASYLIYSPPASGKTSLALLLCRAALATPGYQDFLGYQATPAQPFSQGRVIYMASDGGLFAMGDAERYMRQWGVINEEWTNYLQFYSAHRDNNALPWRMNLYGLYQLISDLDRLEAAGTPVNMIVIDSLKFCLPENTLIGDQVLARYLEVIEGICGPRNVTTVYLSHQSKDTEHPQGIAALTEMVHGYFKIKYDDNQHFFCVTKVRDGKNSRREIPYKISTNGDLLVSDTQDDAEMGAEASIIKVLSTHYAKHLKITNHLDPDDPQRFYSGVQRSDIPILLHQQGIKDPSLRSFRNLDRILAALVKGGSLIKPVHGRYAIGHARNTEPIQQQGLGFERTSPEDPDLELPGWD